MMLEINVVWVAIRGVSRRSLAASHLLFRKCQGWVG